MNGKRDFGLWRVVGVGALAALLLLGAWLTPGAQAQGERPIVITPPAQEWPGQPEQQPAATAEGALVLDAALTPVDGGYLITWRTDRAALGALAYGAAPDALTERAPAGDGLALDHRATLPAAEPGAALYFALVVDDVFVYAGPDPASDWPFKVLAGDPGGTLTPAVRARRDLYTGPALGGPAVGPSPDEGGIPLSPDAPAACPPAGCVAGKNVGRDYFVQVVQRLSDVPYNSFAVDALEAWKPYENTNACWNPLATTWRMTEVCNFNSVGVQSYQNQDMGTRATANTLNLSYYNAIRRMLRLEAFDREAVRGALGTWGTCSGTGCNSLLDRWQTLWNNYTSDPDDNRTIGSGQSLTGTINPNSDNDTYTFDASSGQRATLRMSKNGSSIDSYLILYGPNGAEVARNDDGGGDFNSLINNVTLSQTGRYRVVASSYGGYSGGAYTLRLDLGGGSCPDGQFRGEYFNNRGLSGSATFARCDGSVNFDWGGGGPGGGVANDNFSVRWVGRHNFGGGNWRFIARADDGVRVWVDGNLIIDAWRDQGPTEYRAERSLGAGLHEIKVEYYENGGGAVAQLRWESAGLTCSGQYKAEYWSNRSLSGGPVLTRCENWPINWDWGGGGPGGGVPADNFAARWTGRASFSAGTYTFIVRADDGVRVWLDGGLIIDAWRDQGPTEYRATRTVGGGDHDIRVEYYENGGGAVAQFRWEASGGGGGGGNLALNRPASAWSQESSTYSPGKGNDGNSGTRWSSRISTTLGEQRWWADLGSARTFSRVRINWEAAYAASYRILFSNDGSTWYCYCSTIYSRGGAGWAEHSFGAVTYRYVGVQMLTRAPRMNNYSFYEFEAYNGSTRMGNELQESPVGTTEPVMALPEGGG